MQKLKTYLIVVVVLCSLNSCIINNVSGQAKIVIDQAEANFESVSELVVKGSFCNVNIDSHSSEKILFKGEVKANKERDDIKIRYKQDGSSLEVWIERPRSLRGSFGGLLGFKVPSGTHIRVDNTSGSVHVANMVSSKVHLMASSGSINAENMDCDISAKTSSGGLKLTNINGDLSCISSSGSQSFTKIKGNVVSKLSSGRISMEEINGDVDSESSSGSQSITMVMGNVQASASSGSIKMSDVRGDVQARASSGSIKLYNINGALNLITSSGSQYGEEIMLSGNSSFKASSGSVKMSLSNQADELSFDLMASSGSLSAKGMRGKKQLNIKKGEILVLGVSSSGSQHYY
ncbi:DUF4097 family beta strand repeat-containing protein [Saccharicrinis fermentans]|uniref:DUF4097 domain-containing protein n=1 Tax=Saccharicrinis fermentans DSM 9555 = JCM 21142 TaxID=869213 RepID=W7YH14_9BACT|nr:DUF4097 family beta strand repeat-containing protein [Saccharicrinis fermentans]GAF01889.1 hypothetical protein JCM21142_510 [Saccharicrinis fermentans DSM 9555 = JCM 21142]